MFFFSQFLVSQNADLFAENDDKHTACDLAEKSGNKDIALYLESKMVFYSVSIFFFIFSLLFY